MSERLSNIIGGLLVGVLLMLLGAGLFLWDWYDEYIHFLWFIPFSLLGPIIFIIGLSIVLTALFSGKEGSKETMQPKELIENVRHYHAPGMYYNEKYRFSMQPPRGWKVVDSGLREGTAVIFWGPKDKVFPPIVIIAVDVTNSLEGHVTMFKQALHQILTNYQFVSEKSRMIDGLPGCELVYNYTKKILHLKTKRVYLLKKEKVYDMSFTALQDNYEEYLPVFESSIETFKA